MRTMHPKLHSFIVLASLVMACSIATLQVAFCSPPSPHRPPFTGA